MKYLLLSSLLLLLLLSLFACKKVKTPNIIPAYSVSGWVINKQGFGIAGIKIFYNPSEFTTTDSSGFWKLNKLTGSYTLEAKDTSYDFSPKTITVNEAKTDLLFTGTRLLTQTEVRIINWMNNQQLPNGLLESAENSNVVSLYDNALAALVFMLQGDNVEAEKIFDFFNARISSELQNGVGGFSQLRSKTGVPNNHRWMGDNAWLLIALQNYRLLTGSNTYANLETGITNWLISLQDADGGLFAGYTSGNTLMNYKVTEGNIDAFNAIKGYDAFHSHLLSFLKNNRWDANDKNLVAWPGNPPYYYALDLHPWSYCIFENYPVSALSSAQRFLTTRMASNGHSITGYCFDEDKDNVWLEGTGQMALAFGLAGMQTEKAFYLKEMEKLLIPSTAYSNSTGFPYASNPGTVYGSDLLWTGGDTQIALSSGAWYLFAIFNFNPFAAGREKNMPVADMFWH